MIAQMQGTNSIAVRGPVIALTAKHMADQVHDVRDVVARDSSAFFADMTLGGVETTSLRKFDSSKLFAVKSTDSSESRHIAEPRRHQRRFVAGGSARAYSSTLIHVHCFCTLAAALVSSSLQAGLVAKLWGERLQQGGESSSTWLSYQGRRVHSVCAPHSGRCTKRL